MDLFNKACFMGASADLERTLNPKGSNRDAGRQGPIVVERPEAVEKLDELLHATLLDAPVKIQMRGVRTNNPRDTFMVEGELTDRQICAMLPTGGGWEIGIFYDDVEICTVHHSGAPFETLRIDLQQLSAGLAMMARELFARRASIRDFSEQTGPRGWISRLFPRGQAV